MQKLRLVTEVIWIDADGDYVTSTYEGDLVSALRQFADSHDDGSALAIVRTFTAQSMFAVKA